jgi:hypothetical protein
VLRTIADVLTLAELEKRIEDLETRGLLPTQSEARTH